MLALSTIVMTKPLWMWLIFAVVVIALLAFDLGVMNRKDHEMSAKESILFSVFYISMGLLYDLWIYFELGHIKAMEYLTGFVVEKTLSIDNVFVIAMVFAFFGVPRLYQHRVLFWGILGAVILRGIMIGLGAALVSEFEWVLYIFAAFLIFTGIKMLFAKEESEEDVAKSPILRFMNNHFRVTKELHAPHFWIRKKDGIWITPLLLCLVMVEFADVIFAVDSVPAIFVITTDPYIIYTSNIFAILGLRALYFVLAAIVKRFHYLKYALSLVLVFIGSKTFIAHFAHMDKFPISWSLGITFTILAGGILFSLWKTGREA
ncbi:MAG: TerC family protein [Bdellovibrionales bacterium]